MNQRMDGQVCKGFSSLYQKKSFEDDKNTKLQIAKILFTSLSIHSKKRTLVADVLAIDRLVVTAGKGAHYVYTHELNN